MSELSRRGFIKVTGGAVASGALFGCGFGREENIESLPEVEWQDQLSSNQQINDPATALKQAERLNPPEPLPPPKTWQAGEYVLKANIDFPGVALNYDDGPSPYNTEQILRTLAKYGIKASFYVIGVNAIAWPDILRRIRDEGHEIGNHSYRHWPYRALDLAQQIPQNQNVVRDLAGVNMVSARAPGLTRGQVYLDSCKQNGLYEVHTTIDSLDWKSPRISEDKIINNIISKMYWGAIPLQHDGGNRRPTPNAQEQLIIELISRGYQFDTVTNLINRGSPNPGTPYYASVQTSRLTTEELPELEYEDNVIPIQQDGTACNYNPEVELNRRLNEIENKIPTTSERAERDNIYDALEVLKAA